MSGEWGKCPYIEGHFPFPGSPALKFTDWGNRND